MASALVWRPVQDAQSSQHVAQRAVHASQRKQLVLPSSARLTHASDFARATKSGIRVTSEHFVGYLYISPAGKLPTRAGLIIGKSVGNSVRRHRVSRKIRHLLADELARFPNGSLIVIRGLKQDRTIDIDNEIKKLLSRMISKAQSRGATPKRVGL